MTQGKKKKRQGIGKVVWPSHERKNKNKMSMGKKIEKKKSFRWGWGRVK